MIPHRPPYGASRYLGEEKFEVQHAPCTKIPDTELGPGDNVDPGEVSNAVLGVLDGRGANVGEVLPLDRLEPTAVLLLRTLPLGCANGHVRVPVRLKDFRKRHKVLQMDSEAVLLYAF